jgi:aryl-alcohol dehydrogenase-like predicted oxidoreductase
MYGDSEDLLGKWFQANPEKRDHIFLATKFGNKTLPDGSRKVDSTPEYAKQACRESLRRIGVSHIDLYYCHRLDKQTPVEKTVQAMVKLKDEGKIKYLGLSECSADSLRRAHAVHPITAVQMEYSPFSLEIESEQTQLLKTARELGVAVVAYSPLGRGMLCGTYRSRNDFEEGDCRRYAPRFSDENFPKNLKLVDTIADIAQDQGATASQATLAWLLAQGDDIFPIPGTTKLGRLQENLGSLNITLSTDAEAKIRRACSEAEIVGSRYPEALTASLFADTPPLS